VSVASGSTTSVVPSWDHFGLYVHIPFCRTLCPYCDFYSVAKKRPAWTALTRALCAELHGRRVAFGERRVESVYFGGGTPSLAPPHLFATLLAAAAKDFGLDSAAEITVEANPGSVTRGWLDRLREIGVNRISLGWQSTHDRILKTLGRGHTARQSRQAFDTARASGFDNVSIDLIFAVPDQLQGDLDEDLDAIVTLAPEHVSLYALTFHPGTDFDLRRRRGELRAVDEELEVAMMDRIDARLRPHGYDHYEVSNYARPGFRARHNYFYWTGAAYLGLGPAAHSFVQRDWREGWRWENRHDVQQYLRAWPGSGKGLPQPADPGIELVERLTSRQLFAERMMCGLRLREGVALDEPSLVQHRPELDRGVAAAIQRDWLHTDGVRMAPTAAGLRHADALAELFF